MRLKHIELVEAILRTGSITEAAHHVHISQPAASKLLASVEAQLGYRLFDRVKGRLHPTPEARILEPRFRNLIAELSVLRKLAHNLNHDQQRQFRIGATPALGLGLLPRVIRKVNESQPRVTFDLYTHHSDELVSKLQTRELDIAVTLDANTRPGIRQIPVGQTELVFVSRTEIPNPVSLNALPDEPFIALDASDPSSQILKQALSTGAMTLPVSSRVQTHYVAFAMVEAGCGNTIIDHITARSMDKPGLYISRLNPTLRVPVNALVPASDPLSVQHDLVLDAIRVTCRTLGSGETHK